jgi:hypothetical protein
MPVLRASIAVLSIANPSANPAAYLHAPPHELMVWVSVLLFLPRFKVFVGVPIAHEGYGQQ